MCGIIGMYAFKRQLINPDYFKWCLTTMKHRGPNAEKIWSNNDNYVAGFVRLSIRDLSANGDQPMFSSCGNYCISFNGEIYNTKELQRTLKPFEISFKSTADTELLLYSIIHLGIEKTLQLIDGIYAFAFYSNKENKLILARDRMGIKPLYIGISNNGIVYSSQYDHVVNHSFFNTASYNEHALISYFQYGYMKGRGVIEKTTTFPAAHYALVQNGAINFYRFYNYSCNTGTTEINSVDEVLYSSVTDQLVSDVPLGSFMSGGVDSTLVTYFANKQAPVKSFTMGIKNDALDESVEAASFASMFHTDHNCRYVCTDDLLSLLDENALAFSEPFADASSLPTLLLSKFAKQKITVALSGDGGDELFWGYPRNQKILDLVPFYQQTQLKRTLHLITKKITSPSSIDLSRHLNKRSFRDYYHTTLFIGGALHWIPKIFPDYTNENSVTEFDEMNCANIMNVARKLEIDIHLPRILLKIDKASMYHSLEVRVPFLSNAMLDYSNSVSYKDCIVNGQGKYNLKMSLIKKSTKELVLKPKKGFDVPLNKWIRTDLKKEFSERILDMPPHLSVLFKKDQIEKLLEQHINGKADWAWFIWSLYSFVRWDETHRNKYKEVK